MSHPSPTAESWTDRSISLAEFLAWPRIDEKPYLEYHDGRIEAKVSPEVRHNFIGKKIARALNDFAEPLGLGHAWHEQRCTFGGRSILPDVAFFLDVKIRTDANGDLIDEMLAPPDLHVEIRSPDQSRPRAVEKIEHSLRHGCPLGWFIDPDRKSVSVHRPGRAVEVLGLDGVLDGDPVLPGFRLAVAEVLGWLNYRMPGADSS